MAARRLALTALAGWLVAAPVAAQSSRAGAIEEQQKQKAAQLGTEGPSEAEQIVRRILLSPLLSGGEGVYPWFGSIYGGTGAGVGAGFLKRFERASFVSAQSGLSWNGSRVARVNVATPSLWRNRMQLGASSQWLFAHNVSFYGGQRSSRRAREHYDYSPFDAGAAVTIKPERRVAMSGSYSYLRLTTGGDSQRLSEAVAPGLGRALSYGVARGTLIYDWRPASAYSTRGGYYRATFEHNHEATGQPYTFNVREFEVAQLVPLVREQFVLAARGLVTLTSAGSGDEVPVMLMPYLGSSGTLRGFAHRRFTDRNRALMTGEYRWRPSRYLDMALFVDAGQVSPSHEFAMRDFDVSWGVGARFHGPTFTALRIEVARGREGVRMIFSGSQPF